MNIVGINKSTGKIFESQSYMEDAEKEAIEVAIKTDATSAGIEIEITVIADEELRSLISNSVD